MTMLIVIALFIASAIAQHASDAIKQQPELLPSLEHPGLSEWYVPPKSRNVWALALSGSATLIGLINVIVEHLMQ